MWTTSKILVVIIALVCCISSEDLQQTLNVEENAIESEETSVADEKKTVVSLEELFENGVQAYLENDWTRCLEDFQFVLKSYNEYKSKTIECRRSCKAEANSSKPIFPEDMEDFHFYERKIRETLCLMKCNQALYDNDVKGKQLSYRVEGKLFARRAYEYLHICYYQLERYQDAANAMYTFLIVHPEDDRGKKNLEFYTALPDVDEDHLVDVEAASFAAMFVAGVDAYEAEDHASAVELLEKSIKSYMASEEDCRLYCEGSFDQGWLPDFTASISNHFVFCLRCKRACSHALNNVNGDPQEDLLPKHYHYLQFAYFQLGKIKEACAAIESYLCFAPADEMVLQNKEHILKLDGVVEADFVPREEAVRYVRRQEYERRLLYYIQEAFRSVANNSTRSN